MASLRRRLKLKICPSIPLEEMASHPMTLKLLELFVLAKKPKKILEIGSYIGLSAMNMARNLPPGGKIVTVEKYTEIAEIARSNFKANRFSDKITLITGDVFQQWDVVKKQSPFDVIFIDGGMEQLADHWLQMDAVLAKGGIIAIDDIFYYGDALNASPSTKKGIGARKLIGKTQHLKNYRKIILPIANGIMILVKR